MFEVGFNIRSSPTKHNESKITGDKTLVMKLFIFSKEGMCSEKPEYIGRNSSSDGSSTKQPRQVGISRTGCKACLRLNYKNNKWYVSKFKEDHNHSLMSPSKKNYLKKQRNIDFSKKLFLDACDDANIATSKQVVMLGQQCGAYDKMGCTNLGIRNMKRDKRRKISDYDASLLINIFKS